MPIQFDLGVQSPEGPRGWSEDHREHIHIDATSASYGYLPGPIAAGTWSVLIEVASVPDGSTRYRLSIRASSDLDGAHPTLRAGAGCYAGDLHTHSGHSDGRTANIGAPVTVEDLATAAAHRGLDFVAVTDHNTSSHWLDIDRVQASIDRVLLLHGREITTYHGHFNAIGERRASAVGLSLGRTMHDLMVDAAADGSFVSINHPWLADDEWCAGCRWTNLDRATIAAAQAVEIANGLSEDAIVSGLKSGRVYGRTGGPDGPDIDIRAASDAGGTAVMGQSIPAGHARLVASLRRARGQTCIWIKRGHQLSSQSITSDGAALTLDVELAAGDWVSVLVRKGTRISAWSNAIYVEK